MYVCIVVSVLTEHKRDEHRHTQVWYELKEFLSKEAQVNLGGWQDSVMGLFFNVEQNRCLSAQTITHIEQFGRQNCKSYYCDGKTLPPCCDSLGFFFIIIIISLFLGYKHFYFAWTRNYFQPYCDKALSRFVSFGPAPLPKFYICKPMRIYLYRSNNWCSALSEN